MILQLIDAVAGYTTPVTPPVSLALARGEVVGLTGPNGVGKSTLLKAISGKAYLFSGRIEREATAGIGYLPQQPVRLDEAPLSGCEVLKAMRAHDKRPPNRLAQKLHLRIDQLSGGEYQLLMLWAVLASNNDLVLLDEPTNHLDADHRQTAIEAIVAVKAHRAILVVSHDRAFLAAIATRLVVLES